MKTLVYYPLLIFVYGTLYHALRNTFKAPLWLTLIIINAVIGLQALNWAWNQATRFRNVDEKRDNCFPGFRRKDTHKWNRLKMIPMAITFMNIRVIIGLVFQIGHGIFCFTVGLTGDPKTGFRRALIKAASVVVAQVCIWTIGLSTSIERPDIDYSEYLGKDYKKTQKLPLRTGLIVSNHITYADSLILFKYFICAFATKSEMKKVPIFNHIISNTLCLWISRGATQEERDRQIEEIKERQLANEKDPNSTQIVLYPEGTQSNGTVLLRFKRGAFASMLAVKPVVLKYTSDMVDQSWCPMAFLCHAVLSFCQWGSHCEVIELPSFLPNEYFMTHYKRANEEDWEAFARATREIMSKAGGNLPLDEQPLSEKIPYKQFMTGKIDSFKHQDKLLFEAKPMFAHKKKQE